ncbi:MAG: hypothetical protein KDA77_10650 [Planctomycetaceae bacterium]|nr:hypothetical protein [Planctomycetaceae bacterium]
MTEYHDHEQRLINKTCPSCRADLEQDAETCLFCDHRFPQEEVAAWEPAPLEEPVEKSNSLLMMVALNVIIGLVGTALTSWGKKPESPTYRHPPRVSISAKDRELFSRFFQEHDRSTLAELKSQLEPERKTRRVKVVSVTFSNNPRVNIPYTKDLFIKPEPDLLEKFRVSQQKR